MCKILILQSSPRTPKARRKLINAAWHYFARTGETDGFGAAWVTNTGLLAYAKSSTCTLSTRDIPDYVAGFRASSHLDLNGDGGWMLIHGRKATCGINIDNTHPMLDHGCALIHNGVVRSERFKNTSTSCDSELLLRAIDSDGVPGLKDITGYYAFGLLRKRRDGWHTLIARDDTAKLRVGRLPGGFTAWATTDEALSITNATPIGDAKPMTAVEFTPDGQHTTIPIPTKPITVPRDPEIDSLWGMADSSNPSRFSRRAYSSLLT